VVPATIKELVCTPDQVLAVPRRDFTARSVVLTIIRDGPLIALPFVACAAQAKHQSKASGER
jgi:hypothetical protein